MDWHTSEMEEPDPVFRRYVAQSSRRTSILQTEEPVDRSAATNGSETFSALKQKIEYLESRIATLESLQKTPTVTLPDRVTSRRKSQDDTRLEDEPHYFRGKGFKTYFLGPTNPSSMLKFFPEIHHFVKDPALLQTPLARVQKDLEDMRSREKERRRHRPPVEQNLLTLLPSREIVDRLTRLYFDTYEHIYRILHRPSFWAQYGCGDYHTWSESLVAIVLLVVATVNCLSTTELSFHDQNSSAREAAETWITSVELWLSRQSQKHVTMEFFQTHCLLLLAKRINCIKRKRAWTASGNLLRQAVSSGLHLEPSLIEKNEISVFEQEMRRRLWATIFEWDLDASTMRGVPPLASSVPSNCNAPLNINDDQMESSSELAPKAKPLNEKTETSFLKVSLQSLPLRVSLASTINDSNTHLSFEDILHYEARINEELDKLPMWVKEPNARTCSGLPSTPLPSVSSLTPSQLPVGTDSLLSLELSAHNVMLANLPKLPPLQNGGSQYDFATINRLPDWDLDDLWGFETINS
ncbi:MAG: hypothetical protein LQ340_003599 [Diploschistes diacapsis]|nr:MAG: hypothetical protein LQ340_003599 [Diploschistes diacapsis]